MPRKRIFLLFLGLFVLLLGGTYAVLDRAGAAHGFAQELLSRVLRTRFSLTDTGLDLAGGVVTLEGLQVDRPGAGAGEDPLVRVQKVQLGVETNPLGDFVRVRDVRITGWDLNLSLVDGELPELDELLDLAGLGPSRPGRGTPPITITDSRIRLRLEPGQPAVVFDDVQLQLLPEAPGGERLALRGQLRSDAGIELTVQGSADPSQDRFRALMTATDIDLDSELIAHFRPDLRAEFERAAAGGRVAKATVWVEYGASTAGAEPQVAMGVTADLADTRCRIPELPIPVRDAGGRFAYTTREGGKLRFDLQADAGNGGSIGLRGVVSDVQAAVLEGKVPGYELAADLVGLQIDAELEEALRAMPETGRIWEAFQPEAGTVDLRALVLGGTGHDDGDAAGGRPHVEADVQLTGVRGAYHGFESRRRPRKVAFPMPLQELGGRVRVRGRMVHIDRLTAEVGVGAAKGSRVVIDGWIDTMRADGGETIHLDILADKVAFDAPTRAALDALLTNPGRPPEGARLFAEYNPTGFAAVSVRLRDETNPADKGWQVVLKPLGASCALSSFPLQVDEVQGSVRIDGHGVEVDLNGQRDGAPVRILGELVYEDIQDSGAGRIGMWVEAERIALDGDLRRALETFRPSLVRGWDQVRPGGSAAATVAMWRDPGETLYTFDVQVELAGARLEPTGLPVLIEDLYGPMLLHGRGNYLRLDMNGVSGRLFNGVGGEPAEIYAVGAAEIGGEPGGEPQAMRESITAVVENLALGPRLAETLDRAQVFPREIWEVLRPSGHVDMVLTRNRGAGEPAPHNDLDIVLRGVRLASAALPGPAEDLNGRIQVRDGTVRFRQLGCQMLGAEVALDTGEIRQVGEETEVVATVRCPRFPVDDRLASLLTGPFRDAYRARRLQGDLKVEQLDLRLLFGPQGHGRGQGLLESGFSGRFASLDLGFDLGTRVERCNGRWRVDSAYFGPEGGRMEGALEDLSLRVLGHTCDQLRTRFVANPKGVVFRSLSTQLHGGRITGVDSRTPPGDTGELSEPGALTYSYAGPGVLQADLEMSGVDLRSLLLSADSGADARVTGSLSGQLTIDRLAGDDFVGMAADGTLRLDDANLGNVPVFTAFYALMRPEQRPVFDGARIRARVVDQRITFEEFAVTSPLLSVDGTGGMGMDGYVDLTFRVPYLVGSSADVFIVPTTINALIEGALRVHIHGYLRNLEAEVKSFLQQDPDRQPILPLPPIPERPNPTGSGRPAGSGNGAGTGQPGRPDADRQPSPTR